MRQRAANADRLIAPLLSFVLLYVATFILLLWVRFPLVQWMGLFSVSVATAVSIMIWEHGSWPLGFFVSPRLALPEFLRGMLWGFLLICGCAALIVLTTDLRHAPGNGFPWFELALVFLPAVVHEELLFRGYAFQKLLRVHRWLAILLIALLFAALHAGNAAVSNVGLVNIFLGGVLLGLAYERFERLWFPIGLHLAWNLTTGPILGHEVSGYEAVRSILIETGSGPDLLTGGDFGIEGSVLMTATELVAVALLLLVIRGRKAPRRDPEYDPAAPR